MGTSYFEVQKAIYDILSSDTTLNDLVTGVFGEDIPEDQKFPFVQISGTSENIFNTFDRQGKETTFTIHIWSQYEGFNEAYEIHDRIVSLLDYTNLAVANFDTVYIRFDSANAVTEEDRMTRQVASVYRVIVQE